MPIVYRLERQPMDPQKEKRKAFDSFPQKLVDGYELFLTQQFVKERDHFRALAEEGQNPSIMVIGCCDSRVPPEVIFGSRAGDIFVVRNVANLVPPYRPDEEYHGTSAALEFGVQVLKVEHIVVMGHAQCGGIHAFVDHEQALSSSLASLLAPGDFIGRWIRLLQPAADALKSLSVIPSSYAETLAHYSIMQSLRNLRSFPLVHDLERQGKLHLHGAYFEVKTAQLFILDESAQHFMPLHPASS